MKEFFFKRYAVLHVVIIMTAYVILLVTIGFIFPDYCNKLYKKIFK